MKIIQVNPYYPPYLGGAEQRIRDLSERLAKKGHQVEVFTSDVGCSKDKQLKSTRNLKIYYLKGKEFYRTPIIPSLYKELMKIPQDSIMHVHIGRALSPEIAFLVCKKKNIPYIAHIRANVEPSSFMGKIILNPYKRIFLKKVLNNANKIIALNEDYKNIFSEKYNIDKRKFVVIPNATDFKIVKKSKINLNNPIKILFVGRLSAEKNIDKILKAITYIKENVFLDIVGDGEKRKELEKLIKKLKLNNARLHGKKEGKELLKYYKESDIFCLPSEYESFGVVALEAMANGLPIIASNVKGLRTVVKDNYNGLLVEPTPEKIAEAIEKLIKNPKLRERLAKNGLKEVKKYSWDKIVEQTEKVYEEVLREHNKNKKLKR